MCLSSVMRQYWVLISIVTECWLSLWDLRQSSTQVQGVWFLSSLLRERKKHTVGAGCLVSNFLAEREKEAHRGCRVFGF